MEFEIVGWPNESPTLDLDHNHFPYAGKFVMSNTGKAICTQNGSIIGAIAFNEDRTDPDVLWFRYITVHTEYQGKEIGPKLARYTAQHATNASYQAIKIAVNNPFAYHALYKAGFSFTGEQTGIAELILRYPSASDTYQSGLTIFEQRNGLTTEEKAFIQQKQGQESPQTVSVN
ncbi:MAG: GNAT family N-acetyltransferase [Halobacteriaceae archaeon]